MKKFEYTMIYLSEDTQQKFVEKCNAYGSIGWEISILSFSKNPVGKIYAEIFCKKEIQNIIVTVSSNNSLQA